MQPSTLAAPRRERLQAASAQAYFEPLEAYWINHRLVGFLEGENGKWCWHRIEPHDAVDAVDAVDMVTLRI